MYLCYNNSTNKRYWGNEMFIENGKYVLTSAERAYIADQAVLSKYAAKTITIGTKQHNYEDNNVFATARKILCGSKKIADAEAARATDPLFDEKVAYVYLRYYEDNMLGYNKLTLTEDMVREYLNDYTDKINNTKVYKPHPFLERGGMAYLDENQGDIIKTLSIVEYMLTAGLSKSTYESKKEFKKAALKAADDYVLGVRALKAIGREEFNNAEKYFPTRDELNEGNILDVLYTVFKDAAKSKAVKNEIGTYMTGLSRKQKVGIALITTVVGLTVAGVTLQEISKGHVSENEDGEFVGDDTNLGKIGVWLHNADASVKGFFISVGNKMAEIINAAKDSPKQQSDVVLPGDPEQTDGDNTPNNNNTSIDGVHDGYNITNNPTITTIMREDSQELTTMNNILSSVVFNKEKVSADNISAISIVKYGKSNLDSIILQLDNGETKLILDVGDLSSLRDDLAKCEGESVETEDESIAVRNANARLITALNSAFDKGRFAQVRALAAAGKSVAEYIASANDGKTDKRAVYRDPVHAPECVVAYTNGTGDVGQYVNNTDMHTQIHDAIVDFTDDAEASLIATQFNPDTMTVSCYYWDKNGNLCRADKALGLDADADTLAKIEGRTVAGAIDMLGQTGNTPVVYELSDDEGEGLFAAGGYLSEATIEESLKDNIVWRQTPAPGQESTPAGEPTDTQPPAEPETLTPEE